MRIKRAGASDISDFEGLYYRFFAELEVMRRGELSLYALWVLPQDTRAMDFWKSLGYDVLNSVELAKDIKPTRRKKGERIAVGQTEFWIWQWGTSAPGGSQIDRKG